MEAQLVTEEILCEEKILPEHLIGIPGESWALWRSVCLRSAGFPLTTILDLASTESAAAADGVLDAQEQLERAKLCALELLRQDLDTATGAERDTLLNAIVRLKKGKLPKSFKEAGDIGAAMATFIDAGRQCATANGVYSETFAGSFVDVSRSLAQMAQDKRFREAVVWQNREALHTGIDRLLAMPITAGQPRSVRRNRERLVANYLQRYCTKNDTIGFFGPLGWARFVSDGEAITVKPGADLIAARHVYFEGWALDAFAAALAKESGLQPWLAPRKFSFIYFDGTMLQMPFEGLVQLPRKFATVLYACDGERPAKEIATKLLRDHPQSFRNEAEVYSLLEILRQRGVIEWTLEVPWTLEFPREQRLENNLRRIFKRIGDESLRDRLLAALDSLEASLMKVARAGGDDEQVDQAFGQLTDTFTQLTGSSASRAAGQTYAGRTLIYEDCRRDIDVKLGPAILKTLEGPLPLLLTSARWFTFEVAQAYRDLFQRTYRELSEASGSFVVEGAAFWLTVQPYFFDSKYLLVDTLIPRFQERWERVLSIPEGPNRIHYDSATLRGSVLETFAAAGPGWPFARYHSPDLMIAAASEEAIRRGDCEIVLGELHVGMNTIGSFYFLSQHPATEEVFRWLSVDVPESRLVPVTPKAMVTSRNQPVFVLDKDLRLELTRDPSSVPRAKALAIGSLVVEEIDAQLCIRTRDHSLRFDILDAFADVLSALTVNSLKLLRAARHTPRIYFDRLIVCRETWRFKPHEIDFAFEKEEEQRFLAARRWMRKHSLPRFVFVKTPIEIKPTYLDFESPILIEMFAKAVRQSADVNDPTLLISISEMIPDHKQTWLPDRQGNYYTCEFRVVAVDHIGSE